jgi:aldose 1-epimerase
MRVPVNHQGSAAWGEGFESITLRSPDGSTGADFVPATNMLCCSLRHRGTEILDRGSGVGAYAERGATMGIPLLHPWANRLAGFDYEAAGKRVSLRPGDGLIPTDGAGLPIHGVLPGLLCWDVKDRQPDALAAVLRWKSPRLLELFPFEHQLRIEIGVGSAELRIATTLYARGGQRSGLLWLPPIPAHPGRSSRSVAGHPGCVPAPRSR